jgi:AraC-like DNA-binding protein
MVEFDRDMNKFDFFSTQVWHAKIFHQDHRAADRQLHVLCGGREQCAADYEIKRKDFPYYCVEFVINGQGTISVPHHGRKPLRPGCTFTYGPKQAYHMVSDPAAPLVKYFVDFTGSGAAALLKKFDLTLGGVTQVFPPNQVADTFDLLITAGLENTPLTARHLVLLLEALLINCANGRVTGSLSDPRAFDTYTRCVNWIDHQRQPSLTVSVIAKHCHLDQAYLSRLFRRFARCTPSQYLMRRRLQAAAQRLAAPGLLVKQVADEFAFADAYHFSRAFKRHYGLSPSAFIKRRR